MFSFAVARGAVATAVRALGVASAMGLAACATTPPSPPRPQSKPAEALTCADAASAVAYGFGAATTHAKERGTRDKAYKTLIVELERAVGEVCAEDAWEAASIRCLAYAESDDDLSECRTTMGEAWGQLEIAIDAALAAYEAQANQ